ncbi:DUF3604 domain-containing protein [Pseudohalocynthiibacter aestuariivivens]|uniref:DUF3604 domain-containing protein n=1 Tax=Pseudohalocynthiibacter aestuariivivens TaxID=1591409 RepID=A0ABV5JDM9_9RHOB|nr:DUF3604 domain-containing protein [Pseudohalocynthiibacter aestuariivivens]MBS9718840.1 DUF3604 domain-containing protein [Pseudohalocynthiibacter aestuariivivens]
MKNTMTVLLAGVCSTAMMSGALAQESFGDTAVTNLVKPSYSPYAGRNFPTRPLWGDNHLHTALSLDARAAGVILTHDDAYRFAKGEEITTSNGVQTRIGQPLDWLAITDHSDAMGAMNEVVAGNPMLMQDEIVREWSRRINLGGQEALAAGYEIVESFTAGNTPEVMLSPDFQRQIWEGVIETAEAHNEPGSFTAMIGFEWTSGDGGYNLHRNVFFRDDADKLSQILPLTVAQRGANPERLWDWLGEYEDSTGGRAMAVAHNGNLSNGLMFPDINPETGKPITLEYAQTRARWEPLYETTQIKGDGEAHPFLSPNDEFADYETWDVGNLGPIVKEDDMLQYEYTREALKNGLRHEAVLGVNPFKIGLIGATDAHTGLATAEENNFFGKHSMTEPNPNRMTEDVGHFPPVTWPGWYQAASGYTAVWATENTRKAIFDAMQRREVYATTGPRMTVRFFGGYDYVASDAASRLPANEGYAKGVPMGGDLAAAPEGKSPTFLVGALKDSYSGNLDRIQIVKGWLNADGTTAEQVYDVACGGRAVVDHKCDGAVGNTVDVPNATWTNSIGSPELITVWTDPDFDPALRAVYYARVIEIPTPRWTAYEAKYFEIEAPAEAPMITQERAYTSPIWYTPG